MKQQIKSTSCPVKPPQKFFSTIRKIREGGESKEEGERGIEEEGRERKKKIK